MKIRNLCQDYARRTFIPVLHPLASKLNLKPNLTNVTLANILSGDTCPPIGLRDFERYLTFVTHSVEGLQFIVWFQDYRERYLKLETPCATPRSTRSEFVFRAPNYAETERRAAESLSKVGNHCPPGQEEDVSSPLSTRITSPPSLVGFLLPNTTTISLPPTAHIISTVNIDNAELKTECSRVVATFFSPGAAKELPLDEVVRDTAIRNLAFGCHPDVFLPVYEEVYSLLERNCLQTFLSTASANINLPKQLYWYVVGTINLVIGIIIAVSLIMMVPTPPEANRVWRLIAVGFASVGAAQCYSAWRGYCSQVWMRGNTQLRVWEMQEMDEEASTFVARVLGAQNQKPEGQFDYDHTTDKLQGPDPVQSADYLPDIATIAPFTTETFGHPPNPSESSDTLRPPYGYPPRHNFRRPPIFGPETVVQDPRIKAVHRQLMGEVVRVGIWHMLAFSAIIFSVPGRLHG